MNDHNLDDLIIDNIDPKNSKTKSFLTIIALAIVVLIVAIILTKIILKDPQQQAVLEEDDTELISPELTLQHTPKTVTAPKAPEKTETIKKEIALGKKETSTHTPTVSTTTKERVKITEEFSQTAKKDAKKEIEAKRLAEEKRLKAKEAKRLQVQKAQAKADKKALVQKQEIEAKKPTSNLKGYFIQVGSFTQTPSTRFLAVIKNSGFNYHITAASKTGTKKLLIGPYDSRSDADTALVRVRDRINKSAFVIKK